jgi:uncharacterized Zn-binding protein involved in type VI secretion
MPPAARIGDFHTCPMVNPGPVPHVGGPIVSGSGDVIVAFKPAARLSDTAICVPATDKIVRGSPTVLINNLMAARIGDPTAHGGVIVMGAPNVLIGEAGQGFALAGAAKSGAPYCEECEKARKKAEEEAAKQAAAEEQTPPPNATPPDAVTAPPAPPPAPAPAPATPAAPSSQDRMLASAPGDTPLQRAARDKLARNFYYEYARDRVGERLSPADIDSHVRCIDLGKPVDVIGIPPDGAGPKGDQLFQHTFPGSTGQYFASDTATTPGQLGIHPEVLIEGKDGAPDAIVPRKFESYTASVSQPAVGLRSTAAPAVDTWSIPGTKNPAGGGGTQIMIPKRVQGGVARNVA